MIKVHPKEKKNSTENLNEKTLISSKILPVCEYKFADYMSTIESDTKLKENSSSEKCLKMENLLNTSSASNFHFQDKNILEKRNYSDIKETTFDEIYNSR